MGTRNLIAVYIDGQYKVAQYCQWDGYPDGNGVECLKFLRERMDREKFAESVRNVEFLTEDEERTIRKRYDAENVFNIDGITRSIKADYPELSRDTGAKILDIIAKKNGHVKLSNQLGFADDSLFCEWAWVIDFDRNTFEGYQGFNHTPLDKRERFHSYMDHVPRKYYAVKLVQSWYIHNLPTEEEFLEAFKACEEDSE